MKASPSLHSVKFWLLQADHCSQALPTEVLDNILQYLPKSELLLLLQNSRLFHNVAKRVLYHTIDSEELDLVQCITVLLKLDHEPGLQPLVRRLFINWATSPMRSGSQEPIPNSMLTRNVYCLLHRVLTKLNGLMALSIELLPADSLSQTWILDNCTFSLRYFSTSMPCDTRLARYLDTQLSLTDLTLRGLYQQGGNVLPLYHEFVGPDMAENTFKILPTSLPKLSSFRIVHGGPGIISSVVKGRPVKVVSIALYAPTSSQSLEVLSLSAAPIQRLTIMSFDHRAVHNHLLIELARFPHLEALHLVLLASDYTNESLCALGPLLSPFKSLQYFTFMANTNPVAQWHKERAIAKIWHQSCPTLKTIILPSGDVWLAGAPFH
ncbi:hypothetical protein DXG01_001866 [Tephrocybe rancida]|nr:hypothetical protein DXG01_001866 [Tephrocybe rancida]